MPEKDGLEVIKEFRRKHYRFPIVAMPAHGTTKRSWYGDISKMFGADDVLEKPFTPQEVETIVSRLIKQGSWKLECLYESDRDTEGSSEESGIGLWPILRSGGRERVGS